MWSLFSPSTLTWVWETELSSPGICPKLIFVPNFTLSHLLAATKVTSVDWPWLLQSHSPLSLL